MDEKSLTTHFEFGKNWERFLANINEDKVNAAVRDIENFLSGKMKGRTFLDIGCGSGLSSMAAYRLGAVCICSADIDPINIRVAILK